MSLFATSYNTYMRGDSTSICGVLQQIPTLILLIGILHDNLVTGLPFQKRQDDGIDPDDTLSDLDDSQNGHPFSSQINGYPSLDERRKKCSVPADKSVFYSKEGRRPHRQAAEVRRPACSCENPSPPAS